MRYIERDQRYSKSRSDLRVVSVPNATEPVSLAEAKNYLRITNTTDDTLITSMITQARIMAETYTNSDIVAKVRKMYLTSVDEPFNLYYGPIASIESVSIDGEALVLDESYEILGLDNPLVSISNGYAQKIEVDYTTAGRTDIGLKQGILCNIAWLYYGRDAKMSTNYKSFLSPYKIFGYYGVK